MSNQLALKRKIKLNEIKYHGYFYLYSGYGQVSITRRECYSCHSMALAVSIRPPERRKYGRTRSFHGWSSFESLEWETGSEPRCQNTKHQKNIVKGLESGFELDHMPTYKEYHGPVSITDINDGKSYP